MSIVAVSVNNVASAGMGKLSSMGAPRLLLRPMLKAIEVAIVSSARKNSRAISPIINPISVSLPSSLKSISGWTSVPILRASGVSTGKSATEIASATNSRARTGMRALERPGISMRQAPTRQKTMAMARMASDPSEASNAFTRWHPASGSAPHARSRGSTAPAGSGTGVRRPSGHRASLPRLPR